MIITMTCHLYGRKPYKIALVHGGPGAAGSLHCVAQILAEKFGVIEPYQSAHSVSGQIEELHTQLCGAQAGDIVLLGHSWGAWLVLLYTARYPELVRKVVLVGAGPLEVHYVPEIIQRRLRRLDHSEKEHFARLINNLGNTNQKKLQQLQNLLIKTENYSSLIPLECGCPEMDQSIYADVWPEAEDLRRQGKLIEAAGKIRVPVYIIHGKDDPHPPAGVTAPLELTDVRTEVSLLDRCGHNPFIESFAKDKFYHIIENIIQDGE